MNLLAHHFLVCSKRDPSLPYYLPLSEWRALLYELEEHLARDNEQLKCVPGTHLNFLLGSIEVRPK